MNKKLNLAVIFGGQSGEHEVSLSSARAVMKNLDGEKYNIIPIVITKGGNWLVGEKGKEYLEIHANKIGKEGAISLEESQSLVTITKTKKSFTNFLEGDIIGGKIDLVFPLIHGSFGEDGRLQGMLDMFSIPYVFSGVLAHAICMNKPKAKLVAESFGVTVVKDLVIRKATCKLENILAQTELPVMVKPTELGSSVGITLAKNREDLEKGILDAFRYGDEVLLEQYVEGRELTVTVMERKGEVEVLAVTEIIPLVSEFYDYKAKYEEGGSRHDCSAQMPEDARKKISDFAMKTFQAIGCKDLARVDFMWDEKKNAFYFIDINTIPGMTPTSLAPEAAKHAGINFSEFLDELIEGAMKRVK